MTKHLLPKTHHPMPTLEVSVSASNRDCNRDCNRNYYCNCHCNGISGATTSTPVATSLLQRLGSAVVTMSSSGSHMATMLSWSLALVLALSLSLVLALGVSTPAFADAVNDTASNEAHAVETVGEDSSQAPVQKYYPTQPDVLLHKYDILKTIDDIEDSREIEQGHTGPERKYLEAAPEHVIGSDRPAIGNNTTSALDQFFGTPEVQEAEVLDALEALEDLPEGGIEKGFAVSDSNMQGLPFTLATRFDGDTLQVQIRMQGQSYVYQNSIAVSSKYPLVRFVKPLLPKAVPHNDALGNSMVYFDEVMFEVPIARAIRGEKLTITYQGCDEAGICYPPVNSDIVIDHNIKRDITSDASPVGTANNGSSSSSENGADSTDSGATSSIVETAGAFDLITNNNNAASNLSQSLSENLLLGLLLCVILGIGLDLTPCVLPMLPIFSAMILGPQAMVKSQPQSQSKSQAQSESKTQQKDTGANAGNGAGAGAAPKRNLKVLIWQNLGYGLGLSLTYTVLGLLMSLLGASIHGVLQSPVVIILISLLLLVCALACADVIEIQVPSFITTKLQSKVSSLNTTKFTGAFMLGAISALIASPCTSAPLAGALLYVMQNGNLWVGGLTFFAIGLGMALPLFFIGIFGATFLRRSAFLGKIVKRILVVVLVATAYYLSYHLIAEYDNLEIIVSCFVVYILTIYVLANIVYYIIRHRLRLNQILFVVILALVPTYMTSSYIASQQEQRPYQAFVAAQSLEELDAATKGHYSYVVFTAKWCTNCRQMERTIYSQPTFIKQSADLSRVVVDITDSNDEAIAAIMDKYKIIGVPFYMTMGPDGTIIESQLGLSDEIRVLDSVYKVKDLLHKNQALSED